MIFKPSGIMLWISSLVLLVRIKFKSSLPVKCPRKITFRLISTGEKHSIVFVKHSISISKIKFYFYNFIKIIIFCVLKFMFIIFYFIKVRLFGLDVIIYFYHQLLINSTPSSDNLTEIVTCTGLLVFATFQAVYISCNLILDHVTFVSCTIIFMVDICQQIAYAI